MAVTAVTRQRTTDQTTYTLTPVDFVVGRLYLIAVSHSGRRSADDFPDGRGMIFTSMRAQRADHAHSSPARIEQGSPSQVRDVSIPSTSCPKVCHWVHVRTWPFHNQ